MMRRSADNTKITDGIGRRLVLSCLILALCLVYVPPVADVCAQQPPPPPRPAAPARPQPQASGNMKLNFKGCPMDVVMQDYGEKTGRTLLQAPNLPNVKITLEGQTALTLDEYLQAIDTVLGMNQIALLKVGDKFLKVVPIEQARREEMGIREETEAPKENGQLVSQLIQLQFIDMNEAKQAIDALKHPYAQVNLFERINSILLTDTAGNVNRILQIMKYIDQPVEAKEEPNIIEIHYASAADIKRKLEEVIAESQKEAEKTNVPKPRSSGAPGVVTTPTIPGVIRAGPGSAAKTSPVPDELIALAERGIIAGKVKIVADDRTNILIIITRPENMGFFEKIIKVLDVETAPDVMVKIIRLEYADAESVATTLNSLIGGRSASVDKPKDAKTGSTMSGEEGKSAGLSDYVQQLQRDAAAQRDAAGAVKGKSKVGELAAANIKILADKRTNALLVMASRSDLGTLEEMIKSMDIMLSQVLIEVVIFKVTLSDDMQRGIDWVQRAFVSYEKGANGSKTPKVSWAGTFGGGTDRPNMKDPLSLTSLSSLSSVGNNLTYFLSFYDVNLDAIIKLLASDSRSKIMSSPQILTIDNKPATLNVTQQKYFYAGQKYVTTTSGAGTYVPDVQLKELGIKLTVTPHINEKKYVVMEIVQTFQRPGTPQTISDPVSGTTSWPTIDSSDFTASVAVRSGETIMLGGMVNTEKTSTESKIPLLGDIPIIGNLFKSRTDTDGRDETIVFITPHVLNTPEEIQRETTRLKIAVDVDDMWPKGWSNSRMADIKKPDYAARRREKKQAAKEAAAKEKQAASQVSGANQEASGEKKSGSVAKQPAAPDGKDKATKEATTVTTNAAVTHTEANPDEAKEQSASLDPELMQFIGRQEKRLDGTVKEINQEPSAENPKQQ
jgi:general secretion pathway protein D